VADRWGPPRIKSFLFYILKNGFLKNSLPSVFWHTAKGLFAHVYLPCATHGKGFDVGILTAKDLIPVVNRS